MMAQVTTSVSRMGGHPQPDDLGRGEMLPIRPTAAQPNQLRIAVSRLGMQASGILRDGAKPYIPERQRRVTETKGAKTMTRRSYQQGHVSSPIRTREGIVFKIRWRERTSAGKWKHHCETLRNLEGKKAAREVLLQRLNKASGQMLEATEQTLRQFVDNFWKPCLQRKNVKPSTMSNYQSALDCHILPALGDYRLRDIVPTDIETFVRLMEAEKLSPKSIRNLVIILNAICGVAVDNDLIQRSPVRKHHKPAYRRVKKPVWTAAQLRLILENVPPEYYCLFVCLAMTGVRIGELLALQWKHVNFQARTIQIEQSYWCGQLVSPKTPDSVRILPYGSVLGEILVNHKCVSGHTLQTDFVFCRENGEPINPDVLRKDVLYPVLDRLRIPRPKLSAGVTRRFEQGDWQQNPPGYLLVG